MNPPLPSDPRGEVELSPQVPWPSLRAFSVRNEKFFCGRDAEIAELVRRMRRHLLTVLFGVSGLGKTSLLQAGLMARLRGTEFHPILIRLDHEPDAEDLVEQVRLRIREEVDKAKKADGVVIPRGPLPDEDLWCYFHDRSLDWRNAEGETVHAVLIFDQFEEFFTRECRSRADEQRKQAFLESLTNLVENRAPDWLVRRMEEEPDFAPRLDFRQEDYRVMISLREDFLAHLEVFKRQMPSIMDNRMRLTRMSEDQALQAVLGPGREIVEQAVAREIVSFVAGRLQCKPDAGIGSVPRPTTAADMPPEVDPALLSLICSELNLKRGSAPKITVSAGELEQQGQDILRQYYERCFGTVEPPHTRRAVRRLVEDRLVTQDGFRENIALRVAQAELRAHGADPAALEVLVKERLLQLDDRRGMRVELTHDILTGPALESKRLREASHRRRRALGRGAIALAAVLFVGALVAAMMTWRSATQAKAAERQAKNDRAEAQAAERRAQEERRLAMKDLLRAQIGAAQNALEAKQPLVAGLFVEALRAASDPVPAGELLEFAVPTPRLLHYRRLTLPGPLAQVTESCDGEFFAGISRAGTLLVATRSEVDKRILWEVTKLGHHEWTAERLGTNWSATAPRFTALAFNPVPTNAHMLLVAGQDGVVRQIDVHRRQLVWSLPRPGAAAKTEEPKAKQGTAQEPAGEGSGATERTEPAPRPGSGWRDMAGQNSGRPESITWYPDGLRFAVGYADGLLILAEDLQGPGPAGEGPHVAERPSASREDQEPSVARVPGGEETVPLSTNYFLIKSNGQVTAARERPSVASGTNRVEVLSPIRGLVFSSEGDQLAARTGGELVFWPLSGAACTALSVGGAGMVPGRVVQNSLGDRLALISSGQGSDAGRRKTDLCLVPWANSVTTNLDAEVGLRFLGLAYAPAAVAYTPDGRHLVVGSREGRLAVRSEDKDLEVLPLGRSAVACLGIRPWGDRAYVSCESGDLCLMEFRQAGDRMTPFLPERARSWQVEFAPDSDTIICSADAVTVRWDAEANETHFAQDPEGIGRKPEDAILALSGTHTAAWIQDRGLVVRSGQDGMDEVVLPIDRAPDQVAMDSDGRWIAAVRPEGAGSSVRVWDLTNGGQWREAALAAGSRVALGGGRLAVAAPDGQFLRFALDAAFEAAGPGMTPEFEGDLAESLSDRGMDLERQGLGIPVIAASRDGRQAVVAYASAGMVLVETGSSRVTRLLPEMLNVTAVVLSPDGNGVLAGDSSGRIIGWSIPWAREQGGLGRLLAWNAHDDGAVAALALSRDGRRLVSVSDHGQIVISGSFAGRGFAARDAWRTRSGLEIKQLTALNAAATEHARQLAAAELEAPLRSGVDHGALHALLREIEAFKNKPSRERWETLLEHADLLRDNAAEFVPQQALLVRSLQEAGSAADTFEAWYLRLLGCSQSPDSGVVIHRLREREAQLDEMPSVIRRVVYARLADAAAEDWMNTNSGSQEEAQLEAMIFTNYWPRALAAGHPPEERPDDFEFMARMIHDRAKTLDWATPEGLATAESLLARAALADPRSAEILVDHARAAAQADHAEAAEASAVAALQLPDPPVDQCTRARMVLAGIARKRWQEAAGSSSGELSALRESVYGQLRQALSDDPAALECRKQLIEWLIEDGETSAALPEYEQYFAFGGGTHSDFRQCGLLYAEGQDFVQASRMLRKARLARKTLSREPVAADVAARSAEMAESAWLRGDTELALAFLDRATTVLTNNAPLLARSAQLLEALGLPDEAAMDLAAAVAIQESDPGRQGTSIWRVPLAEIRLRQGKTSVAREVLLGCRFDPRARLLLGVMDRQTNLPEATRRFQEILGSEARRPEELLVHALAHAYLGHPNEALATLTAYRQGLAGGGDVAPGWLQEARVFAVLSEQDAEYQLRALVALGEALRAGLMDGYALLTTAELAPLRSTEAFQLLLRAFAARWDRAERWEDLARFFLALHGAAQGMPQPPASNDFLSAAAAMLSRGLDSAAVRLDRPEFAVLRAHGLLDDPLTRSAEIERALETRGEVRALERALDRLRGMHVQRGRLGDDAEASPAGWFRHIHSFAGEAGEVVRVRLFSREFDTYLYMRSPSGQSWENDDANQSRGESRIEQELPDTGDYRVVVTSYNPGEKGVYELTIQPADATVRRHSGELKPGRSAEVDGALTDLFTFFGRAGTSVQIDLDSSDFDTVLVVRSPSGEEWENDDRDGDADKNSRLTVLLPEDGEYTVRITSYEKGKGGAYTLSLDGLTELQEVPSWEKVQPLLTRLERLRDCQGLDRYGRPFNLRAGSGIGLLDPATQAQVAETLRLPDLRDLWSVYPTESDNGR